MSTNSEIPLPENVAKYYAVKNEQTGVITSALSLRYMRIVRRLLMIIGAWPVYTDEKKLQTMRKCVLRFWGITVSIFLVAETTFVVKRFKTLSFVDLGDNVFVLCITVVTLYRVFIAGLDSFVTINKEFILKFHMVHLADTSEYVTNMRKSINFISHYYTLFMTATCVVALVFFNLPPLFNNLRNNVYFGEIKPNYTIQYSVNYIFFDIKQDNHVVISSTINMILSLHCAVAFNGHDMVITLIVLQIIGRIKVLLYDLAQFPKPKAVPINGLPFQKPVFFEVFNAEENDKIRELIKKSVDHHRFIVRFTEDASSFYGPMLGLNYLFQLLVCCLLLLECSQGTPSVVARFATLLVAVLFQLCHISITFEVVGSESTKLIDAVYALPWESMDLSNQRSMCILLNRVQTPIHVTAMGMTPVGVQTMLGVLKATASYFALLQSIDE